MASANASFGPALQRTVVEAATAAESAQLVLEAADNGSAAQEPELGRRAALATALLSHVAAAQADSAVLDFATIRTRPS